MIEKQKWIRNCPKCNRSVIYKNKSGYDLANGNNSLCNSCAQTKYTYPSKLERICHKCDSVLVYKTKAGYRYGLKHNSTCYKCIDKTHMIGTSPWNKGTTGLYSNETLRKMRMSAINRIEVNKLKGGQMKPNYNPNSIAILEQKAKELGITDLQHAENGGEFFISELGYWVDGYSKEKNIVFEFDEAHHFDSDGNLIEKDIKRQKEIQKYLGCEFIRISH